MRRPGAEVAGDPEPDAKEPIRPFGTTQPCIRPLKEQVRSYERDLIESTIRRCGSKRKAAQALGVDIGTIVRKTRREGRE